MKDWGGAILIAGIIGLVAALAMDTSVSTGLGRVNNLGLMQDQQNYIIITSVIILGGLVMMAIGWRGSADHNESGRLTGSSKTCPQCAETIKSDAKVCRYCGNREFPIVQQSAQPGRTLFDVLIWDRTQGRS